ncbi:hypothetical protein [Agrobacterium tumefaciens]|uniref:Uncharacterized protein n=1 Tax=Agrobacterium tumefaciens TaxID=358 RepID=A0A4D7YP52_AGRTU|nr:hypothetical protein [Agrobacterium tumefaciens]QCL93099.1 hypothetical protein CFBP7129_01985 [Agrobacterium tumefaciens]
MDKIEAVVQHVSIFRIRSVYLIGALYEFETDNQEGRLDIVINGNNISFCIDPANGPKKGRTATTSTVVHILSETNYIPAFSVNKGNNVTITVPVFSLGEPDQLKVAGELFGLFPPVRQTLAISPKTSAGIPADLAAELGIGEVEASVAREWGWRGW